MIFTAFTGEEFPSIVDSYTCSETMSDYVDPGFHTRMKNGEVFNHPMSYTANRMSLSENQSKWFKRKTDDPTWWMRLTEGNYTAHALKKTFKPAGYKTNECSAPIDVERQAKQACLADVDSTPYEFFEDIAELRETIRFLRNPLESLKNVSKSFKKKKDHINTRPWQYKRRAKALADLWAQYRFAAAPLVRSIMSALEAYNERDKKLRPARRTAHGHRFSEALPVSSALSTFAHTSYPTDICHWEYVKTSERVLRGHASIYYEVSNPLDNWNFRLGLRLKDIPVTLWEVVPLSFMVDRLVNIKNAISGVLNLSDPTVAFLASSYTTRDDRHVKLSCVNQWYGYNNFQTTLSDHDHILYEDFRYDRVIWDPGLTDTIPAITPKYLVNDVRRATDLIALIIGRLL